MITAIFEAILLGMAVFASSMNKIYILLYAAALLVDISRDMKRKNKRSISYTAALIYISSIVTIYGSTKGNLDVERINFILFTTFIVKNFFCFLTNAESDTFVKWAGATLGTAWLIFYDASAENIVSFVFPLLILLATFLRKSAPAASSSIFFLSGGTILVMFLRNIKTRLMSFGVVFGALVAGVLPIFLDT